MCLLFIILYYLYTFLISILQIIYNLIYYIIVYIQMNTIFIFLLIIIITLTLFLANVITNVTEGYVNTTMPYDPSKKYSNKEIAYADAVRSILPNNSDVGSTSEQINYDAKTYDSSATIQPGSTLGPFMPNDNNYGLQYHDEISQDVKNNWSKTMGNVIYNEPGSLRFGSSNYVPNYEESIFLSPVTGLRYNQPMYIESKQDIGFCEFNKNSVDKIEEQCNKLDKNVCSSTGCCVLLGGSKCVAGNNTGPLLKSNYGDIFIRNKDVYYHQGKCYGNCSKNENGSPTSTTFVPTTSAIFMPTTPTLFMPTTSTNNSTPTPTTNTPLKI